MIVKVRSSRPEDLAFIVALAEAESCALCYQQPDFDVIASALDGRVKLAKREGAARLTIAEDNVGCPTGFLLSIKLDVPLRGCTGEVYLLAVSTKCRKAGVGRALVQDAVEWFNPSTCIRAVATRTESEALLTKYFGFNVVPQPHPGTLLHRCAEGCPGGEAHT